MKRRTMKHGRRFREITPGCHARKWPPTGACFLVAFIFFRYLYLVSDCECFKRRHTCRACIDSYKHEWKCSHREWDFTFLLCAQCRWYHAKSCNCCFLRWRYLCTRCCGCICCGDTDSLKLLLTRHVDTLTCVVFLLQTFGSTSSRPSRRMTEMTRESEPLHMQRVGDRWMCRHCNLLSSYKRAIKLHVVAKHMQCKRYSCRYCGQVFKWNASRLDHERLTCPERARPWLPFTSTNLQHPPALNVSQTLETSSSNQT